MIEGNCASRWDGLDLIWESGCMMAGGLTWVCSGDGIGRLIVVAVRWEIEKGLRLGGARRRDMKAIIVLLL